MAELVHKHKKTEIKDRRLKTKGLLCIHVSQFSNIEHPQDFSLLSLVCSPFVHTTGSINPKNDLSSQVDYLMGAVADGRITPDEATKLTSLLSLKQDTEALDELQSLTTRGASDG